MVTQDAQIACWGVSTWIIALAWFQIVLASFGIIELLAMLTGVELPNGGENTDHQEFSKGMIFFALALLVFRVALTILLLIENKIKKLGFIWSWQLYEGISLVFVIIGAFTRVFGDGESVPVQNIVAAAILAFAIYVVNLRVQDILADLARISGSR